MICILCRLHLVYHWWAQLHRLWSKADLYFVHSTGLITDGPSCNGCSLTLFCILFTLLVLSLMGQLHRLWSRDDLYFVQTPRRNTSGVRWDSWMRTGWPMGVWSAWLFSLGPFRNPQVYPSSVLLFSHFGSWTRCPNSKLLVLPAWISLVSLVLKRRNELYVPTNWWPKHKKSENCMLVLVRYNSGHNFGRFAFHKQQTDMQSVYRV